MSHPLNHATKKRTRAPINNSQALILELIVKNPKGLTRKEISDKVGFEANLDTLGPTNKESIINHRDSLYWRGLVEVRVSELPDGRNQIKFHPTPLGMKFSRNVKGRQSPAFNTKIPSELLDPAVMKVRVKKTYSFEVYTEEDLKEVLFEVGEEYSGFPLEALRENMMNRRKQGAYAASRAPFPEWYTKYRLEEHFTEIRQATFAFYGGNCALNHNHNDPTDIEVYHRWFYDTQRHCILDLETVSDCIALCSQCYKRNAKFMFRIPERDLKR